MQQFRSIARTGLIAGVALALGSSPLLYAQKSGPLSPRGPRPAPDATVARPKQPEELPRIETRKKQEIPEESAFFTTETNLVNVDVAVVDEQGRFIPGIPQGNFLVLEDKVPQKVASFGLSQAPMTVCLLIEFNARFQQYWSETWYQTLTAAYGFTETLRPEDWVAVVAYDLRPEILSDFTKDRRKTYQALQRLRTTGFSEANLYDALVETAERMSTIEGRKAIVLISTGMDTFSKLNYGETRRRMQDAGVTVYAVGMMQMLRQRAPTPMARSTAPGAAPPAWTSSKPTTRCAPSPKRPAAWPSSRASTASSRPSSRTVHYTMRNQYTLAYSPTNQKKDGKWRKIKVRLIDPKNPKKDLRITRGSKSKRVKYQIVAKAGYRAPNEVE